MKKILILFFFIFIASCQPIERAELVVFDNNQLSKFDIFSKSIEIQSIFEKKISEPYIGYTLKISPHKRIEDWLNNNFKAVSNENKFKNEPF